MKTLFLALTAVTCTFGLALAQNTVKWVEQDTITTQSVAGRLADSKQQKPLILQIGFATLYKIG